MTQAVSTLGRLEDVDLREAWPREDRDFTPWLAEEYNIELLASAIGINLEVEEQEKRVGQYRADILCRDIDSDSDNWVLIENQLDPSNHRHLGQLLTYAAGLDAVTVVWIAKKFSDEHSATLDWLNEITPSEVRLFGLEIELWRIGESQMAPKFNVVSRPNDWSGRKHLAPGLSAREKLQLEYWDSFIEVVKQQSGVIQATTPAARPWIQFSIGRAEFGLRTVISVRGGWIDIRLVIRGDDAKAYYNLLLQDKDGIEDESGLQFEWRELPANKESQITLRIEENPNDRDSWSKQHNELLEKLNIFHKAFAGRISKLNPDNYSPSPDVEDD